MFAAEPLAGAMLCDLRSAWSQGLGGGVVSRLLGGTPQDYPERYNSASPIELLPTGTKEVLIHGTIDNTVPISQSEQYVERARKLDDQASLCRLEETGHFELIDPDSEAWPEVVGAIRNVTGTS